MHIPTAAAMMIAARAEDRELTIADWGRPLDPAVRALAARIEVSAHEFGPPDGPRIRRARVTVARFDGATASTERGAAGDGLPPAGVGDRFRAFAAGAAVRDPWSLPADAPVSALFADPAGEMPHPGR